MTNDKDVKVGIALLDEVEEKIRQKLGNSVAITLGSEYNAELDIFAKDLIKQCELAEKKSDNHPEVIARSNFLKGRLYGFYFQHGPMGYRAGQKKAASSYEKAIESGFDEAKARYYLGLLYAAGLSKEKAIENLEKVIEIEGENSELGIESSKEIEKIKAKKGGCFIATAACGSENAPDVLVLRSFRDRLLLTSKIGRFLIDVYYYLSPVLARVVSSNSFIRKIVYRGVVRPVAHFCKKFLCRKG